MVNETSADALLKGDIFLLVLGGDFFHIRNRALVEYPGSAHKNTGQLQGRRGIPKGDRRPPLCRRGGGVHRGGTPSKGSLPYACFCLLFPRGKSRSGAGAGGPESHQIEWQYPVKKNVSPPPARRYANLSASVPCAGIVPSEK